MSLLLTAISLLSQCSLDGVSLLHGFCCYLVTTWPLSLLFALRVHGHRMAKPRLVVYCLPFLNDFPVSVAATSLLFHCYVSLRAQPLHDLFTASLLMIVQTHSYCTAMFSTTSLFLTWSFCSHCNNQPPAKLDSQATLFLCSNTTKAHRQMCRTEHSPK